MKIDTNLWSLQINVPHSEYGECEYFIPGVINKWLKNQNLRYSYCGGGSWGDGFTNGVTNKESVYMVRNIQEEDATAFQIQFPHCKVHLCEQFDYS